MYLIDLALYDKSYLRKKLEVKNAKYNKRNEETKAPIYREKGKVYVVVNLLLLGQELALA